VRSSTTISSYARQRLVHPGRRVRFVFLTV
jgi:hypothetical protein